MRVNEYPTYNDTVIINDGDPDLIPIKVSIKKVWENTIKFFGFKTPDMPQVEMIDFYDEPRAAQYFRIIHEYPERLKALEDSLRKEERAKREKRRSGGISFSTVEERVQNRFWELLNKREDDYLEEIEFIRRMWYFRLFGYWFMNNDIPTYIPGSYFVFLYYYYLRTGNLPQYRDRDRRWFLFQQFARFDTDTFDNMTEQGWAIPEEDDSYIMKDTGSRVCFGTITSKPRRVGDTSKVAADLLEEATRTVEGQFGNQAMDDLSAERIFKHYINTPLNKYPIIFKPIQDKLDPAKVLYFNSSDPTLGLGSWIDYATSKHRSVYDGTALKRYYADEAGKVRYESIKARHGTVRLCLTERDVILGFCNYTTTVEEMEGNAADDFMSLSRDSMFHQRKDNGQTKSGMYVCFFPAFDGHPKFIDKYGMSVIGTPSTEQALFIKQSIGAKEYLINQRKLLKGEDLALAKRQDPVTYRECFSPDPKNQLFKNVEVIQERITDLKFETDLWDKGFFRWEKDRFGRVEWVSDEDGRFIISKKFGSGETNRWELMEDGHKQPKNPDKYISCADAFRLEKTETSRMSDGGFAVFWNRDYDIDPEGTPNKDLKSDRFVLSYRYRPDSLDEFCEDCLMACIYTGAMMYPENNVNIISDKFLEWGYGGYLLYDLDYRTGSVRNNAGFNTAQKSKAEMFNLGRDHIQRNVRRECHYDILLEAIELRGLEDMKNKDLLTAALGCFLGKRSYYAQFLAEDTTGGADVSNWMPQRNV